MKIFYSWQSDLPNNNNRNFIDSCIEKIIKKYRNIITIEADRDTKYNTGSPDIATTIFDKIESCDLFIADISIINKSRCKLFRNKKRATPNPNVLLELGYAACALGWDRVICIYNTDYSDLEALPFDLRQHRVTSYSLFGKDKSTERESVVKAISATIDGLLNSGNAIRPKGTRSLHRLFGVDIQSNTLLQNAFTHKIDFSKLRNELIEKGKDLVDKLNSSSICFTGTEGAYFNGVRLNYEASSIITITDEENTEVTNAVKKLLGTTIRWHAFCFGNLKKYSDYLRGGYKYDGDKQEIHKYEDYLLLKRYLTEIVILDLFCIPFENILMLPLAIKNISSYLDKNINITITIEGDDFELVPPTEELFNDELSSNVGFICDYGFIVDIFAMIESPEIKSDEDLEYYNYFDDNPSINLWDAGTTYEKDNCLEVLEDYVVTPSGANTLEFRIGSLQANEIKWLNKVALIKVSGNNIKLKYSIRSDNTDGSISDVIEVQPFETR